MLSRVSISRYSSINHVCDLCAVGPAKESLHGKNGHLRLDKLLKRWFFTDSNRITSGCSTDGQHSCTGNPLASLTWDYDPFGNRYDENITAGGFNGGSNYTFNGNNQISNTPAGITYDALGNVLTDGPTNGYNNEYTYDAENRVTSVAEANSITYTYDPFSRRVEQNVGGVKYDYVYGPGGVADLWTSSGLVWALLAGRPDLGVYGNSTTTFYHVDWQGTLRATSSSSGQRLSTCTNYAFGDNTVCTSWGPGDIHFTGQELDGGVDLMHFPMRNYSMGQGRWIHTDPAGLAAVDPTSSQTWNRYSYVMNNPLTFTDPTGLRCYAQEMWHRICGQLAFMGSFGSNWNEFDEAVVSGFGSYWIDGGCLGCSRGYLGMLANFPSGPLEIGGTAGPETCDAQCLIASLRKILRNSSTCAAAYGGDQSAGNLVNKMTLYQVPSPYTGPFQGAYNAVNANNQDPSTWQYAAATSYFTNSDGSTWDGSQFGTFVGNKFDVLTISQQDTVLFHELAHPYWGEADAANVDNVNGMYSPFGGALGGIPAVCGTDPVPPTPVAGH